MVALINGGSDIGNFAAIADNGHIRRAVPQSVDRSPIWLLPQGADNGGASHENVFAVGIDAMHAVGSDLLAGMLGVNLNVLRCNFS